MMMVFSIKIHHGIRFTRVKRRRTTGKQNQGFLLKDSDDDKGEESSQEIEGHEGKCVSFFSCILPAFFFVVSAVLLTVLLKSNL